MIYLCDSCLLHCKTRKCYEASSKVVIDATRAISKVMKGLHKVVTSCNKGRHKTFTKVIRVVKMSSPVLRGSSNDITKDHKGHHKVVKGNKISQIIGQLGTNHHKSSIFRGNDHDWQSSLVITVIRVIFSHSIGLESILRGGHVDNHTAFTTSSL